MSKRLPSSPAPLFSCDNAGVIVETVKLAEESDAVVVRLYEAFGGRQSFQLTTSLPVRHAEVVNVLEEPMEATEADAYHVSLQGPTIRGVLTPFRVLTLKLAV